MSKEMKVRILIQHPSEQEETEQRHRRKIRHTKPPLDKTKVTTALVLLVAIGAIGFYLFTGDPNPASTAQLSEPSTTESAEASLTKDNETETPERQVSEQSEATSSKQVMSSEEQFSADDAGSSSSEETDPEIVAEAEIISETAEGEAELVPETEVQSEPEPIVEVSQEEVLPVAVVEEEPETTQPEVVEAEEPQQVAEAEPAAGNEAQQEEAEETPSGIRNRAALYDDRIRRAQLTQQMIEREPQDWYSQTSPLQVESGQSIYFFSEVINASGQTINHIWIYNGSQAARVELNIGSDRWRTFSRKSIPQGATGSWQVEVRDQNGKLLASQFFNVI